MDKPKYQKKPIGYIDSLAKALSVDKDYLVRLADQADSFYYLHERREKPDGSFREIYGVKPELKSLHRRINKKIYLNIYFPHYLHGSIKDRHYPRSSITAAAVHTKKSLSVKMDISNFYPSLTSEVVFDIWKRFFNFPELVAELLTKLTTFNGSLPQGAPTSSGLANLAFWDRESAIVHDLQQKGFKYTRFVDDVTVSSENYTAMHDLAPIFASIFGMFSSKGVKPNRNKIDISTSGYSMVVHNLNVNAGVPTIPRSERGRIRAAVKDCERNYPENNQSEYYEKLWESTKGRVNFLNQLHFSEAESYRERLEAVRPVIAAA